MTENIQADATPAALPRSTWLATRLKLAFLGGTGSFCIIFLLMWVSQLYNVLLLIPPFGASCALLFAVPQSPLSRPRNTIGGHLIAGVIGLIVLNILGLTALGFALSVSCAIAAMILTETLHPPAGATALVVMLLGATWKFLFMPLLAGTVALVLFAWIYHRFVSKQHYKLHFW